MNLLRIQGRVPGGPSFFRLLASAHPPAEARVEFGGITFPTPVGLGSGIDVDGRAALLMQELGFGFLELGPLGVRMRASTPKTKPRRFRRTHGLALSGRPGGDPIGTVLPGLPALNVPVGVRLRGERLVEEVELASTRVDFLTLPIGAGGSLTELREVRASSGKPIFVRIHAGWDRGRIERVIDNSAVAGVDGAIVVAGAPYPDLGDGELVWHGELPGALEVLSQFGERIPGSLSGGVLTPEDADSALSAGAHLVFLSDGLVFAGPGLPKRINTHLAAGTRRRSTEVGPKPERQEPDDEAIHGSGAGIAVSDPVLAAAGPTMAHPQARELATVPEIISELLPSRDTIQAAAIPMLVAAAMAMLVAGLAYLILAAVAPLLSREAGYVGMQSSALCRIDHCRLVEFIAHGRGCYGGALVAVGAMYCWLVVGPLRRGEVWAWWALLFAGVAAQGSYFSFLAYDYVDTDTAVFIFLLIGLWTVGLILVRPRIKDWQGPVSAFRTTETKAWMWSPAGRGRLLIFLFGAGLVTGGTMILSIASTDVFVPQDLAFIGISSHRLDEINRHLIPVMAHDRAGFGGALLALGIMFVATAQKGIRPGARGAWRALGIGGAALVVFAFASHIAVGYLDFIHLSPVYSGAVLLAMALITLRTPLSMGSYDEAEFPDV